MQYLFSANGGWTDWLNSTEGCSVPCGGGVVNQSRSCTNPAPVNGGALCILEDGTTGMTENKSLTCNEHICPGEWNRNMNMSEFENVIIHVLSNPEYVRV